MSERILHKRLQEQQQLLIILINYDMLLGVDGSGRNVTVYDGLFRGGGRRISPSYENDYILAHLLLPKYNVLLTK